MRAVTLLALALPLVTLGCVSPPDPVDRSAYLEHFPRSILVLPPLDETIETEACAGTLSTLTRPLAEQGYYVFPVAMVDLMMRENWLPTPYDMHQVPLSKLDEIFAPDAVLYLKVTEWGTEYQVINSATQVALEGRLVDVASGQEIWSSSAVAAQNSSSGNNNLIGMLASALVNQVTTSIYDPSRDVAMNANWSLFSDQHWGLLYGPYHAKHQESLEEARAEMAEQEAARAEADAGAADPGYCARIDSIQPRSTS